MDDKSGGLDTEYTLQQVTGKMSADGRRTAKSNRSSRSSGVNRRVSAVSVYTPLIATVLELAIVTAEHMRGLESLRGL